MPTKVKTRVVPSWQAVDKLPKPDYSEHVEIIKRGETYTEFAARVNEKIKIFLAAFSAGTELPVGATVPLFDFETFIPTPYTSPIGWLADFREWMINFDGLVRLDTSCADFPGLVVNSRSMDHDFVHTYEQVIFFDTKYWDPTAVFPHVFTFTITNEDTSNLTGCAQVAMVLRDIKSDYAIDKKVKCLSCGNINTVKLDETRIKCVKCGTTFFVPFFGGRTI